MRRVHEQVLARYNALSFRERVLVGGTVIAITWAVWLMALGDTVIDNRAIVVNDLDRVAIELERQHEERARLLRGESPSRAGPLDEQRDALIAELDLSDAEIEAALSRFVPAEDVRGLLEDVIAGHDDLQLVRIESQPSTPLGLAPDSGLRVYRHPVQVELKGSYMDLLAYLDELEESEWGLSWRRLEYVVQEYPDAHVLIEVETLSREEGWLGV